MKTNRIAVLIGLSLTSLSGCAVEIPADGMVTPWAAIGFLSFERREPVEVSAPQVDAQVARLLDAHERAQDEAMLAAR